MITINPFSELSALIPPLAMQAYVILMVIFVAGGTILDMAHKKSAKYFFQNSQKAKKSQLTRLVVVKKFRLLLKQQLMKY